MFEQEVWNLLCVTLQRNLKVKTNTNCRPVRKLKTCFYQHSFRSCGRIVLEVAALVSLATLWNYLMLEFDLFWDVNLFSAISSGLLWTGCSTCHLVIPAANSVVTSRKLEFVLSSWRAFVVETWLNMRSPPIGVYEGDFLIYLCIVE